MTIEQAQRVIALWALEPPTMDYYTEYARAIVEHDQAVAVLEAAGLPTVYQPKKRG